MSSLSLLEALSELEFESDESYEEEEELELEFEPSTPSGMASETAGQPVPSGPNEPGGQSSGPNEPGG